MAIFAWNESYSVRVQPMDEQHQKLFEIINTLAEAMRAGKGDDMVRDTVEQLAVYTRTHFLQEEALMRRTGYPGLAGHQQQHRKLMEDVEQYKVAMEQGRAASPVSLLNFVRQWLVHHIRESDRAYTDHLNAHGVQ
ncbi:MAG TPA: bacteriohemerythrin [Acidobacteriaceae bacterium]|jgi:hemerythrin|nr:bacteriohemerythrin [Acidobacteriaceae bacterium]